MYAAGRVRPEWTAAVCAWRSVLFAIAMVLSGCGSGHESDLSGQPGSAPVTVFAAASTTDVMREAGRRFEEATGTKVRFNFAASSTLAQQIAFGAKADLFLSASAEWMDEVERSGEVVAGSRVNLLGNALVMIAPIDSPFEIDMSPDFEFAAKLPAVRRIAMGDPAHVPAGRYARVAFTSLGWWDGLQRLIISTVDVRAALRLVELGEADAGVVYATDAAQSDRIVIIAAFPRETHDTIVYPAALCAGAGPGAEAFLHFLRQDDMADLFGRAGFTVFNEKRP